MPTRAELVAALLRPLDRLVPHVERLLGAPPSEEEVPAPAAEVGPWRALEQGQPAPRASAGAVPQLIAPPRAVHAEIRSRDHLGSPRLPVSTTMSVVASDPLHAGPAPAVDDGTSAPRAERSTSRAVVPGAVRRPRAAPPWTTQARTPAPGEPTAVVAAAPPMGTPASPAREVAIAAAPAGFAAAPAITVTSSRPAPAPAGSSSSPTRSASQPSRAMLPLPISRWPAPLAESWARAPQQPPPVPLPRDAGPPSTAQIPVLRIAPPRHHLGASPAAASVSDTLDPRRLDPVQTPLDREALEDALADILRDAARREGLEV